MKHAVCIVIYVFFCWEARAQDTIIRKNGDKISCEIRKTDNFNVYFEIYKSRHARNTFLSKSQIDTIIYEKKEFSHPWFDDTDVASLGIGIGQDLGGWGGNLIYYPQRNIGIFGGLGYAFAGVGFNGGIKIRAVSKKSKEKAIPFLVGMYGYNTAIVIRNAAAYSMLFYGPTFGLGFDYRVRPESSGYFSFGLLFPLRDSKVAKYMTELKAKGVKFENELLPVTLSVSYKIIINYWQ